MSKPLYVILVTTFVVLCAAFVAWAMMLDLFVAGRLFWLVLVLASILGLPAAFIARICRRRGMTISAVAVWAAVIVLLLVPWHPRKRFVSDLYSVKPGMTVEEVERVMGRYVKGTGWVIPDGPAPVVLGPGEVLDPAETADIKARVEEAQAAYKPPTYPAGEERAHATGTMTYRWNGTDSAYNADWGQVEFKDGRVVNVEFLPD